MAVNTAVFIAMALTYNSVRGFNIAQLAAWGGNCGLIDVTGQWWRLVAYQFVHMNLWHLAINMWVMWTVGRLTERFYGSLTVLLLYLVTGALAGLFSIVWNPDMVSVGASGPIFGVMGAFLVYLYRSRYHIPISLLRYWLPALLFSAFSIYSGAYQPAVDNAAHVGGLISGLVLGGILTRAAGSTGAFSRKQFAAAATFVVVSGVSLLWYSGVLEYRPSAYDRFAASHDWYLKQEAPNVQLWATLAAQAAASTISSDDLSERFRHDILPFWEQAYPRLRKELKQRGRGDNNPFLPLLTEFARLRLAWARAIIAAASDSNNTQKLQTAVEDEQQTMPVYGRILRLRMLMAADTLPYSLADSAFALRISEGLPGHSWHCVESPSLFGKSVSATDSAADGPARRDAIGCLAQRLFVQGAYVKLDELMKKTAARLGDLPDGGSSVNGIINGLDDLFSYGKLTPQDILRHTARWRRAVPGSVEPDLVEATMFRDWAYAARGHGVASTVSAQAFEIFGIRAEMAAASVREAAPAARNNPLWYQLSLGVERDQALPIDASRHTFDSGAKRFPHHLALDRQMVITLMPRWGGSADLEEGFIVAESKKAGGGRIDPATYAYLYIMDGNLEGQDFDVVRGAEAQSAIMTPGLEKLRRRYPKSDYILNAVARFACLDDEFPYFRRLRPQLKGHLSATAWPDKVTLADCDRWAAPNRQPPIKRKHP